MSLIDRLQNPPVRGGAKSKLDVWLESLSEPEQDAVRAAAVNKAWGHTTLAAALAEEGGPRLSANSVRGWRVKHGWTP